MNYYGEEITFSKRVVMEIRKLLTVISPALNSTFNFLLKKKCFPRLVHPKTLDEKLIWLKLNYYAKSETAKQCADKFAVREYLEKRGYGELLNDLLFAVDRVEDIPWEKLPEQFAIKWSFGSGYNIICSDKASFDLERAKEQLSRWGKIPYWKLYSELHYRDTNKKIIGEKFLKDKQGGFPVDYKFYCFNGVAKCVMICTQRETGVPKFYFFDREWNLMRINKWGRIAPQGFTVLKPDNMDKMFEIADELSKPFPFVRFDLYDQDGKIVFGEFTFAPSGGVDPNRLKETDYFFGNCLSI